MKALDLSDRSFIFDVAAPRTRIPTARLIESLKEFAASVGGRAFTNKEYDAWPRRVMRATHISKRCGGWRNALKSAGVEGARNRHYTSADLMAILESVWRRVGQRPTIKELQRFGWISQGPYEDRWGSVTNACERLAAYHAREISRAKLLACGRPKRRPVVRTRVRWAVFKRDRHRCTACGRAAANGAKLEVDHIVPVSKGGSDDMSNLRTLCRDCNRGKGAGV